MLDGFAPDGVFLVGCGGGFSPLLAHPVAQLSP
jgi:hypothetical protein